jgi:hypothetical protein
MINLFRKNLLLGIIFLSLLIKFCAVNKVSSIPAKNKFVHIDGTPAYVLIETGKSVGLINDYIYLFSRS